MSLLSLTSYNDLLKKCNYELFELNKCVKHPDYDFILFNIVLGLNHLFEWYLKDLSVEETKKQNCVQLFNPYKSIGEVPKYLKHYYVLSDFPEANKYQKVIRDLCNKAKHFKQVSIEKQDKNYTIGCGEELAECGEELAECGAFDHYTYSVDISGINIDLICIISTQIELWTNFVNPSL